MIKMLIPALCIVVYFGLIRNKLISWLDRWSDRR